MSKPLSPKVVTAIEHEQVIAELVAAGLLDSFRATAQPLQGGVSSDIWLVSEGSRRFVVKKALAKLKVRDDWFADTNRNRTERNWLKYATSVMPGSVPRLLASPENVEWFAMEFLDGGFVTWKSLLLDGTALPFPAHRAGEILGRLHADSWGRHDLAVQFGTHANFHELRIAPYLLTAADRVPHLSAPVRAIAEELGRTRLCVIHGDFSPKNLLTHDNRLVVLDAEVACFGDPAFDASFLLTHLMLKALLQAPRHTARSILDLMGLFWQTYRTALQSHYSSALEVRTVQITLGLLLARVHGKSPVEYLRSNDGDLITDFVRSQFGAELRTIDDLTVRWAQHLRTEITS